MVVYRVASLLCLRREACAPLLWLLPTLSVLRVLHILRTVLALSLYRGCELIRLWWWWRRNVAVWLLGVRV
jgi:hypothetical protein